MKTSLASNFKTHSGSLRLGAIILASLALPVSALHAQSQTWNNGTGNSTWDTTSANWVSPTTWTANNTAVFGATGVGAITVSGTQSLGNLTFSNAGYSLNGGTLNFTSATSTINATAAAIAATISSDITGTSVNLLKEGAGRLTLTGNNTLTGNVAGSNNGNTFGTNSSGTGVLEIAGGTSTFTNVRLTLITADGIISGGNLTFNGAGNATGNGLRGIAIGGGITLTVNGTAAVSTNRLTIANGSSGTLTINNTASLSNTDTVTTIGVASALLVNSIINLNGGTLSSNQFQRNTTGTSTGNSTFNFNGGTLRALSSNSSWFNNIGTTGNFVLTVQSGGAVIDSNGFDVTINQALANGGGGGGLTKNGAGTLTLNGSNTYTGATTLSAGTLSISTASALGSTSGVGMANGTTLAYTGAAGNLTRAISVTSGTATIQNSGSGLLTLSNGLSKNGTTMVLKGGSNGITVNGAITGTAANSDLILDGGSITLASANTYNGPTYLLNGTTLTASVANALPTANGRTDVTMDATGSGSSTLALGASQSVASLTGAASSNVTLGSNTLTIGTTSGSTTFAGRISGSGNLVKDGASTQVLSGTNTFTGTTTINSGTLQAASANALGSTSSVVVNNGGSLLVTADDAIGTNTNITLNSTSTSAAGLAFSGNYNGTVGLLTLSKDSIIDLGLGSVVLRFSDIVGLAAHALKIYNWTGETLWGGTNRDNTDQIYVTADLNDPARAGELGNISFYSDFGNSFLGNGYQLTGSGFYNNQIIPVPESETWLGAAILLLAAAAYSLRRKNDPARNEPPA